MLTLLALGLSRVQIGPIILGEIAWISFIMVLTGTALGIGQPAANNAALDVLPGKIASATGVRNMFRLTGGLIGTSMVALILAIYGPAHEVLGFAVVFNILAVINLCNIPIVFFIPDSARLRRQQAQQEQAAAEHLEEVLVEGG